MTLRPQTQCLAPSWNLATTSSTRSLRGGYGHGLAADVVSTVGATRDERRITTELFWKWIDEHEAEFSIGRPYLDRDPPHVGPIDGNEYIVKRALFGKRAS